LTTSASTATSGGAEKSSRAAISPCDRGRAPVGTHRSRGARQPVAGPTFRTRRLRRADGKGGFTVEVSAPGAFSATMSGRYRVDPASERVWLEAPGATGTEQLQLVVGPDARTLLGSAWADPTRAQLLIVSR